LGVAALVLGMIGAVFAVVPYFAVTQIAGVLLGGVAIFLGRVARGHAKASGLGAGMATVGMVVGGVAIALSLLAYTSFVVLYERIGSELEGGARLGGAEFHRAMERAVGRLGPGARGVIPPPPVESGGERRAGDQKTAR